ncbi:GH15 family glucan-1,4-alpha-glucosidase [Endobacter medicaginis]|uniref:GH15 family glucan-1,4-alpha-glucosidase n=3 Tax=Endobacter medicaginis TaxID=1181271 RepID=A0A839UZ72_9PROT|nr:GH15 family glucan-1,4-alpha-glucosidase [Endobacter medicaginis]MCX5477001.1 glycoside hydrolase family 15 protein [Endobacter medicaginis]
MTGAQTLAIGAHGRDGGDMPIEHYAALGDGRSVALLAADGAIDWWCLPGMADMPAFGALLAGEPGGGCLTVAPSGPFSVIRRYVPDSNVVEHVYETAGGRLRATFALNGGIAGRLPWSELAIRLDAIEGEVPMRVELRPALRVGRATSWREDTPSGPVLHLDGLMLALRSTFATRPARDDDAGVSATVTVRDGERHLVAVIATSHAPLVLPPIADIDRRIDRTIAAWREWLAARSLPGPWRDAVARSALALKLLLYAPTGAIAAAATNGLPERIGGDRNYDYRYAWVRDAALSINALLRIGAYEETQAAFAWLAQTVARHGEIRTMYGLEGDLAPEQTELDLPGWRGSRPVLHGNRARSQLQLGVYGDLLNTASLLVEAGHVMDLGTRRLLAELTDRCADLWMSPDSGLWELAEQQHYTYSKMACWAAMDRAVRLAELGQIDPGRKARWSRVRDAIAAWVERHGWSEARQSYVIHPGSDRLDASILLAIRMDYPSHDRMRATCRAIDAELSAGPLLYRYSDAAQEEGTFVACAFWLVQGYALLGERDTARRRLATVLDATGHNLGLLSEEMAPDGPTMLGNIPQALSHLALIGAAHALGADPAPAP